MAEKDEKQQARGSGSGGGGDAGQAEVQARTDEVNERGYFGTSPDETPRENYTLKGVGSGAPTPETERVER